MTFYLITGESCMESVVEDKTVQLFKEHGFHIVPPPEVKASRTIIVKQIDAVYKEATEEDFMNGISLVGFKSEILEVVKIPSEYQTPLIKIRFARIQMAEYALNNGIKIFEQSVPPKALHREVCIKLEPCTNCFAYNHIKTACPKNTAARCTVCAREGHRYYECPREETKCLNCREGHTTFDKTCSIRKKIIKEKTKEEINKENDRAKSRHRQYEEKHKIRNRKWDNSAHSTLPPGAFATIVTALVSATMIETRLRGTFQSTYDDILDHNLIPRVKLPVQVIDRLVQCQNDNDNEYQQGNNINTNIEPDVALPRFRTVTMYDAATTETEEEIETQPGGAAGFLTLEPGRATQEDKPKKLKCKRKRKAKAAARTEPMEEAPSRAPAVEDEFMGVPDQLSQLSSMSEHDSGTWDPRKKTKQPEDITPPANNSELELVSRPLCIEQETPPTPRGAIKYNRASGLRVREEGPMSKLQELRPIIFYPVSWKLTTPQVMLKFLDGQTFIHYVPPADGTKISTRKLIRDSLAQEKNPDLVINYCSLSDEDWKERFARLYPA